MRSFYVNKRAEQIRSKLQLVINYQLLNHFPLNDKLPIPNKLTLLSHLAKTTYFFKFNLESGFWRLGIHLEESLTYLITITNEKLCCLGSNLHPLSSEKRWPGIFQHILYTTDLYWWHITVQSYFRGALQPSSPIPFLSEEIW